MRPGDVFLNILRDLGDSSNGWKNVLELASRFLSRGGYLMQYDKCLHKSGNVCVMEECIVSSSLQLQLYNQAVGTETIFLLCPPRRK